MEKYVNTISERQYFIDWLRILLILSIFLFHIGMIFNTWDWHVKNDQTYGGVLRSVMTHLHYWRMPLLFLISGAGTYFALGKRTTGQYLRERLKRLVLPLSVGIFTLVPIQVYIEKSARFDSLWDFYPHMFEGIYPSGNFSWHHLWFIAYLFIISLFISPFLGFLRGERFANCRKSLEKFISKPLALNVFIIPLILSQALLRPYFPEETHALVDDWASVAFYVLFFLAGFVLLSSKEITNSIRWQRWLFLGEAIVVSVMLFTIPYMFESEQAGNTVWDILSIFVAWSCGVTAIGFARQHLNRNSRIRKLANEAIYPFYLLHQPLIVVTGSLVIQWEVPVLLKVLSVTLLSFIISVAIYWFMIRPFNVLRLVFGMKINLHDKYLETKGYRIHAAQMLNTLSSNVKNPRVPANTYETEGSPA